MSEAYDILGNPSKKQRYDAQLRQQDELERQAKERERKQAATRRAQKEQEKKDRLKRQREMVKNAKALDHLVMKLSTIDQFEKAMLVSDNHGAHYKQHSILMFVSNKNAEKMGEEEYYFPYPFAGEEGDYAGLIQVAKVNNIIRAYFSVALFVSCVHLKIPNVSQIIYEKHRSDSMPKRN